MAEHAAAVSPGNVARKRVGRAWCGHRWWVWGAAVLVLGTLTPIGVAWGIAILGTTKLRLDGVGTVIAGRTMWEANAWRGRGQYLITWSVLAIARDAEGEQALRERVKSWTSYASSDEAMVGQPWPAPAWSRTKDLDVSALVQGEDLSVGECGFGWPWVVMCQDVRGTIAGAPPTPRTESPGSRSGAVTVAASTSDRARRLPIRPAWSGLSLSMAAYSGVWAALIGGVAGARSLIRASRRRQREKNGCCPQCAYDLRGDLESQCPECGWRRTMPSGA